MKGGSLKEGLSSQEVCDQKKPTKETKTNQRPVASNEKASSEKQTGTFTMRQ